MRVLITGATGLIGSAVCDALLARGDEVVGLTRDPEKAKPKNPTMRWYPWQALVERPPAEAFDEVDGVINLIGEEINQRLTDAAKQRIRESRVTATRNLLQGIAGGGVETEGVRRPVGDRLLRRPRRQDARRGVRASARASAPSCSSSGSPPSARPRSSGRESSSSAPASSSPRHGGLLKQLLLPFKLGVGGPIAGGEQYMSWIHIDDEVGLLLWALDNDEVSGTINATAPNPVTNKEFSKALGKALHRPSFVPVPKLAVAALRGSELAEMVTGSARVMPRRALDMGFRFRYPELGPALEAALK